MPREAGEGCGDTEALAPPQAEAAAVDRTTVDTPTVFSLPNAGREEDWSVRGWSAWITEPPLHSWVWHRPAVLQLSETDEMYHLCLAEVPWHYLAQNGRPGSQAAAWFTRHPCTCTLSCGGQVLPPHPIPPWLAAAWGKIATYATPVEQGRPPDGVHVHLSRQDASSQGWQAGVKGEGVPSISLALGGTQTYQVRRSTQNASIRTLSIEQGSLIASLGSARECFAHRFSASSRVNDPDGICILLTWRWVLVHSANDECPSAVTGGFARPGLATQMLSPPDQKLDCSDEPHLPVSRLPVGELLAIPAKGFVGHDLSSKGTQTLRIIAFQAQSRLASGDATLSAEQLGKYLQRLAVDIALVSETGLRDRSKQLTDFKDVLRKDFQFLTYAHYPPHLPKGKGVLIITKLSCPARAKSLEMDRHGRALAATIPLPCSTPVDGDCDYTAVRVVAGYGVTGGTTGTAGQSAEGRSTATFLTGQILRASEEDVPVIMGLDANSVDDPAVDSIGTSARSQGDGLITQVLSAGCQCSFRMHFPTLQIGTRMCPSGANFLTRIVVRQTPYFRCAAAAVHWEHRMPTDHAPLVTDVVGVFAPSVPTVDEGLTGMSVTCSVPWRRFVRAVTDTRAAVDKEEALQGEETGGAQGAIPERAFLTSIEQAVQERNQVWRDIAADAEKLQDAPEDCHRNRAALGRLSKSLVENVNQVVCSVTEGRVRQVLSAPRQASTLSRTWTCTRAALQVAAAALPPATDDLDEAFVASVRAAKSFRAACKAHLDENPSADTGALAKRRIPAKPRGRTSAAKLQWVGEARALLCKGRHSWQAVSARLHKQAATTASRDALSERRAAHRKGDFRTWLALLAGPRTPTYPAPMEAPTSTTPAAKLAASAKVLQRKYGTRRWDPSASPLFCCRVDEAGRTRGSLTPLHGVPAGFRAAAVAARCGSVVGLAFGDLSRPLSRTERDSLWSLFADGAPGKSQFKITVTGLLGREVQNAVVALVEAIIRLGLAPGWLKMALVVWADKPSGGVRGLSLLEELLKAPDSIMTRRVAEVLHRTPLDSVLSASNVGYQRGRSAALVLDVTQDFFDEAKEAPHRCLSHIP